MGLFWGKKVKSTHASLIICMSMNFLKCPCRRRSPNSGKEQGQFPLWFFFFFFQEIKHIIIQKDSELRDLEYLGSSHTKHLSGLTRAVFFHIPGFYTAWIMLSLTHLPNLNKQATTHLSPNSEFCFCTSPQVLSQPPVLFLLQWQLSHPMLFTHLLILIHPPRLKGSCGQELGLYHLAPAQHLAHGRHHLNKTHKICSKPLGKHFPATTSAIMEMLISTQVDTSHQSCMATGHLKCNQCN